MNEDMQLQVAVRLAKQGDTKAFEDLYNLTYKYAFFHAKSILKDENEAWDLVQDTYIAVYQNIGTLKEDKYIKSWIGGIVFNLGHKRLRKKTDVLVGEDGEFLFESIEDRDKDLSPEEALDSKETISIVRGVIDSLPVLQKAAVIAYYFDGKSIATIADEAMCSVGTIKSRLNYARKAMKDCIEQEERKMGVTLHTVTAPVIILVLRNMFTQLKVSEQKAQNVLTLVEKNVGLVGAAAGAGTGAAESRGIGTAGASVGSATETAGTGAGIFSILFGTVKMKIITVILVIVIIGGGIWGVSSMMGDDKKVDAPVETSMQTESETEPTVVETTEATEPETTEAEPEPGWVEVEDGWKFMEEDRTYVSHTWKEIDGELYYFKKNEMMAVGDVYLGRQVFSFNGSGVLEKIAPADGDTRNTTFYDEDVKYYVDGNSIHFTGEDGQDRIVYSLPQKIFSLSVDGDTIYFMIDQKLCSIKTDGTGYKEELEERGLWTAVSIASEDGKVSFSFTDRSEDDTEIDADIVYGGLYGLENGKLEEKMRIYGYPPEYKKLQQNGDWTYYLFSNAGGDSRVADIGELYYNVVYRATGDTGERVTGEGVEEYFVYGDTIYYMQNGEFKKESISEATRAEREQKEFVNNNPVEAYNQYVNEVLINEYGKFNSFHVEYGYGMREYGFRSIPAVLDTGIISTHIEDMDLDGAPELMVFLAKPSQDEGMDIDLYVYHIEDGEIKYLGEGMLFKRLFWADEHEIRIFIKDFGDRKVIGASSKGYALVWADGTGFEFNLYQIDKANGLEKLLSKDESASEWDDSKASWVNDIMQQGFEVTASEWAQQGNEDFFISDNEQNCKDLITGRFTLNVPLTDFYSLAPEEGEVDIRKVVGDIIVHN